MPEYQKSISDARQTLPTLSENAGENLDRYIITNQGQPQSVLIGYPDYQSLKAATQILQQPGVLADIQTGLQELEEGQGLTLDEVAALVEDARPPQLTNAVAAYSGLDEKTVALVLRSLAQVTSRESRSTKTRRLTAARKIARARAKSRETRPEVVEPA